MNISSSSQSLHSDILFELDSLQSGSTKRRLMNELVKFKNMNAYIYAEHKRNFNESVITITIVIEGEKDIYHFDITPGYPFRPPKNFRINYIDYKKYLYVNSPKTLQELKIYKGVNCLCCHTILCCNVWSPALQLNHFINEFKKIKEYRRYIINRLLAQKIINKYLISDINLFHWL